MAAAADGAAAAKPRKRKRVRKPRLDFELSSSSEDEPVAPKPAPIVAAPAEAADSDGDSSSSESSALLSDSSDDEAKKRKGKQRAIDPSSPAQLQPTPIAAPIVPVRQRSPSPPYFGFSNDRRTGRPILWGRVPGDADRPPAARAAADDADEAAFRELYLAKVVGSFENELAGVQKDATTQDRIDRLVGALAGGADLYLASEGDRAVALEATNASTAADDAMEQ